MISTNSSQQLLRTAAVLQVFNNSGVQPMIDFFVEQLGFTVDTTAGEGPKFATLDRDGQTIMLNCRRRGIFTNRSSSGWGAYFWVNDIEAIYAEFQSRGTKLKDPPFEKPYGCKEVVAIAPDGREIVFGEII